MYERPPSKYVYLKLGKLKTFSKNLASSRMCPKRQSISKNQQNSRVIYEFAIFSIKAALQPFVFAYTNEMMIHAGILIILPDKI